MLVAILSLLVILLISQLCWRDMDGLYSTLAAVPQKVTQEGEYWRVLTALAVHADMKHFLSNALLFSLFSYLLFGYFGFWVYPVLSLLLGSLATYLSLLTYPSHIHLVGASTVVYLMAGFWLAIYLVVERSKPLGRRILHAVGVGLVLLMPTALQPSISYRSHAIGFGVGVAFALAYFILNREKIRTREHVLYDLDEWHDGENQYIA